MSENDSFQDLVRRVRAGDERATTELVQRYAPTIQRAVRARLTDAHLQRLLDSVDICQSVFANFFVRAAAGQSELDSPKQLLKLLETMARNKLTNHALHHRACRRDHRRLQEGVNEQEFLDPSPSPSQVVAHQELLEEVRKRLSEEERHIVEQRALGRPWTEIAAMLGAGPEGVRKRFERALDRVACELGLE